MVFLVFMKWIHRILIILYVAGAAFLFKTINEEATNFKEAKQAYAKRLNINENVFDPRDYFLSNEYQKQEKLAGKFLAKSEQHRKNMISLAWLLGLSSLLILAYSWIMSALKKMKWETFGGYIIIISAFFLLIGITVPMMEIAAYIDGIHLPVKASLSDISETLGNMFPDAKLDTSVDFDGKLYAFYQTKSILDLIDILFISENYLVAIAILFFSVIFPILKLLFSTLFIYAKQQRQKDLFVNIISYIGKYSMADVFVVATILAYLAFENMNPGVVVDAKVLIGLHVFTCYCILSILVFFVVKHLKKKHLRNEIAKPELI